MRLRRRFSAAVVLLALVLVPASGAFAQEGAPPVDGLGTGNEVVNSWSLSPGSSGSPEPGSRSFLAYDVVPGSTFTDVVTVANFSNVQLTFEVYATDAFNNDDGDFAVLAGADTPVGVGAWVSLPQRLVTVPPRAQVDLPVTVTVPIDAQPGDHVGAILAASRTEGTGPDGKAVTLDRRTGTRLYVRVAGPLSPELAVEGITTTHQRSLDPFGGAAEVTYRVENRGNVRLGGSHSVSVSGPLGIGRVTSEPQLLPELLPGESLTVTTVLEGVPATGLAFTDVTVEPAPVAGDTDAPPPSDRSAVSLAVPWTLLAMMLVAVLLGVAGRAFARRGRQGSPPSGGGGSRPGPPRPPVVPVAPGPPTTGPATADVGVTGDADGVDRRGTRVTTP